MPNISVSVNSIAKLQASLRKIEEYKNSIPYKLQLACEKLADYGVNYAVAHSGNFGNYISFSHTVPLSNGAHSEVVLTGRDVSKIVSRWYRNENIVEREVSPLLMAEFGSGQFAENPMQVNGVGRGTFPEQIHAFQDRWFWTDADTGESHSSSGIKPTQPMFKTRNELMQIVASVFREVFKNNV